MGLCFDQYGVVQGLTDIREGLLQGFHGAAIHGNEREDLNIHDGDS